MMKSVVVSQRVDNFPSVSEIRDALDQNLVRFLLRCGMLPFPIPNCMAAASDDELEGGALDDWLDAVGPMGIVLSGGNDIGSIVERDKTETHLLKYAQHKNLPVLGICRGMQLMGGYMGVGVKPVEGHVKTRHIIDLDTKRTVNSYHNYALFECPSEFKVLHRSCDDSIESILHNKMQWLGIMWHPERETPFTHEDISMVTNLFQMKNIGGN